MSAEIEAIRKRCTGDIETIVKGWFDLGIYAGDVAKDQQTLLAALDAATAERDKAIADRDAAEKLMLKANDERNDFVVEVHQARRERDALKARVEEMEAVLRTALPTLCRCKEIVDDAECECDEYYGFTCSIHGDREMVNRAIAELTSVVDKEAKPDA